MLATVIEMLVGIGGTVIYLYFWNQILAKNNTTELDPTDPTYRAKMGRRRAWQIILFLGLTPYVLLLFAAIERIKATLLVQT